MESLVAGIRFWNKDATKVNERNTTKIRIYYWNDKKKKKKKNLCSGKYRFIVSLDAGTRFQRYDGNTLVEPSVLIRRINAKGCNDREQASSIHGDYWRYKMEKFTRDVIKQRRGEWATMGKRSWSEVEASESLLVEEWKERAIESRVQFI